MITIEYPQVPKGITVKIETPACAYDTIDELNVALDEIRSRRPLYRFLRYFGFAR